MDSITAILVILALIAYFVAVRVIKRNTTDPIAAARREAILDVVLAAIALVVCAATALPDIRHHWFDGALAIAFLCVLVHEVGRLRRLPAA